MFVGFSLTVGLKTEQLDITVAAPNTFKNNTLGLLGLFNGDLTDDLMTPAGQLLPNTSTEKTIFENFGELCKSSSVQYIILADFPWNICCLAK